MIFKILYGLMVLAHLLGMTFDLDEYEKTITYKMQYAIVLIGILWMVVCGNGLER